MAAPNKTITDVVTLVKSWVSWRSEPANVSRDFWMPDQSCRVCYECDAQFTLFNRRHHCRLCGRIFCGKCTGNSVPASPGDSSIPLEDWDRIRVCNYCFKQWQQGIVTLNNGVQIANHDHTNSSSPTSLESSKSGGTADCSSFTFGSMVSYQQVQVDSSIGLRQPSALETNTDMQVAVESRNDNLGTDTEEPSPSQYVFTLNRSDDEDDDYSVYNQTPHFPRVSDFYSQVQFDEMDYDYTTQKDHQHGENSEAKSLCGSMPCHSFNSSILDDISQLGKKDELDSVDICETPSSIYVAENINIEPVDFENNGLLWLPPEPEDEEDEKETILFEDDDDDGDGTGEWGYFRHSSSFGNGEQSHKDKSSEENKKIMKNVVDGHFRALVSQLLLVENLPVGEDNDSESWLEIITSLSWEAASLVKPDTSKGGGMDPGGYVKVKCIASGQRCESMVVKGVVCKKNVAHRRMASKIKKPRMLILGGALEYQRVSNHLSSFDTLLQQEMDHLKMAVAKIDAHHPDVLLVEKSVSRFAQEYLLAKDISLVLNIKRPLFERIARCTGSQIVPSIDHLSSQRLGHCDIFHVEKYLEEHGSAGQGGKKLVKTLMYFDGCPKPLGCTILLRGANGDELRKVKHVVQYGIFAAYHLAMETSFLADEGASLPELSLNSPITVALPDKTSSIERSISTVPGFVVSPSEKPQGPQPSSGPPRPNTSPFLASSINSAFLDKLEKTTLPCFPNSSSFKLSQPAPSFIGSTGSFSSAVPSEDTVQDTYHNDLSPQSVEEKYAVSREPLIPENSALNNCEAVSSDHLNGCGFVPVESMGLDAVATHRENNDNATVPSQETCPEISPACKDTKSHPEEPGSLKEEFHPAPSDNQSILVSLSSRCVWKGTVCEKAHLFRIKYYGNFDKPLGRYLRDHLFDPNYRCHSCDMPSEAHVNCYTHRQGTLTISVKKLPEFLLPGEREGKIWMWHRCLRCPRISGFPPATRRIVMSDAAWGLSLGKFLELSFSNHAAASRVASCGHSLHRDCLRFYGFGNMVACFRYASINVNSVYLPPFKLHFSSQNQEWIQKEIDEVVRRAELLFSEVLHALGKILQKRSVAAGPRQVAELEGMLQKERIEFNETLHKTLKREAKKGQPIVDILEINRLRRQLLFQSYMWDHRLIYVASSDDNSFQDGLSCSVPERLEKPAVNGINIPSNSAKSFCGSNSFLADTMLSKSFSTNPGGVFGGNGPRVDIGPDSNYEKEDQILSPSSNICEQYESRESETSGVRRALSEGHFPMLADLSDTLDAAWIGENTIIVPEGLDSEDRADERNGFSLSPAWSSRGSGNVEYSSSWLRMPFLNFYRAFNKNFLTSGQKLDTLGEYKPVYVSSFRKSELQGGARLLLPVGVNDTVVPVFDDEPTSIIAYALVSQDYYSQISDEGGRPKDVNESFTSSLFTDSSSFISYPSVDESISDSFRSFGFADDGILSMTGPRGPLVLDPISHTKSMHPRISFSDDGALGKVNYSVTCYYAKRFEALRRICCPSELDFIRSLSRCKKWGAQGGKSNVFFAKTLDDRFVVKQVTKTELESFIKFGSGYFKYLSESISTRSPTCLAKILGIYQVTTKHLIKGGKESRIDVLVMENLLFGRNVTRLYDLKGSSRSRYNSDTSGSNKVLLDQNLIEAMPTSPIFVGNKAKRLLERAVWNDTSFLASVDVMDYSLLLGMDEEKHELVLGIIDFMRQYTWDKHLETWVKASGILGGPKNSSPTVISPKQYKKRFRKAMSTYFLMLPDQWSPANNVRSQSQSDLCDENSQCGVPND